ncbi:TPA: arylsulfatase [Candidatus Poribacteria bacterium]|nr:arylsulfatase [Candidatus Poribacteria bacterium]HIO78542.1 arylsulfatase [Candidatus Poribacteria bacterium]
MSDSKSQPNFLWIYGEDLSPDLACYGTPVVQTPNLDRLAAEGARYTNAFVTCSVCSPSRSAIITGTYQVSFDAHNHRSNRDKPLRQDMQLITDCFRSAGYFTSNSPGPPYNRAGKTDFNFVAENPFDGIDWSQRADGQPFYAQINIPVTHRDFVPDLNRPIDPEDVEIPPYYPNHPITHKDWAMYLESIQVLDRRVGWILKRLDEENLTENTVIFFMSDHGRAHPRGKQFLYDGGTRIPLIVRWPDKIEAGTIVEDLVSGVDFAPTTLSIAGLEVPDFMQGQIFLGEQANQRRAVFSARDRCDETDDRIRAARNKRFKYIRNYYPDRPYTQFNAYKKNQYPVLTLMEVLHDQGKLTSEQAQFMAETRPVEEFYDLESDPYELNNLIEHSDLQDQVARLKHELDQWIHQTGDMGAIPESEEIATAWDQQMANQFSKWMQEKGLSAETDNLTYLDWWEQQLGCD